MDVELQILKHLKRNARPTVSIIDQYCSAYNDLFSDVRSYRSQARPKGFPKGRHGVSTLAVYTFGRCEASVTRS
jgi:hypothetical protein